MPQVQITTQYRTVAARPRTLGPPGPGFRSPSWATRANAA
jgi:hypothetical protein